MDLRQNQFTSTQNPIRIFREPLSGPEIYALAFYSAGFVEGFNRGTNAVLNEYAEQITHQPGGVPSLEAAKTAIKEYFERRHGDEIDYGDLVETFGWPLPLIVDACEELEREGKIAGVD